MVTAQVEVFYKSFSSIYCKAVLTDNQLCCCSGQVDGNRPKAEVFAEIEKLISELQEGVTEEVSAPIGARS